jgi:ribosomal protein S10
MLDRLAIVPASPCNYLKTIDSLMHLEFPAGVDIEVKM